MDGTDAHWLPDVEMELIDGRRIKAADFRGQKLVVFVCATDEPIACEQEIRDFSSLAEDFADCGTWVLGLLAHDERSAPLIGLCQSCHVPVAFDPDGSVAAALGLWKEKDEQTGKRAGIERTTFLLQRDGTLYRAWKGGGEAAKVLEAARELP